MKFGKFALIAAVAALVTFAAPAPYALAQSSATQADDATWTAAQQQNTSGAYGAYLSLYPTGRHAAEARTAQQRLQGGASASTPATPAASATPLAGGYDLAQLNPQVRAAVIEARAAMARGQAAASTARQAAQQARDAATHARAGNWANHAAYNYQDDAEYGRRYEGQYSSDNRNGYGVITFSTGLFSGDRYEGQWTDGNYNGSGVYTRAMNENNREYNGLRYEGQYANSQRNGFGIFIWRGANGQGEGHRYTGEMRNAARAGHGVMEFADGQRYEGEWGDDGRAGFGVEWSATGALVRQGIWTNDQLTTPLTR